MLRKSTVQEKQISSRRLVPAMINRRRITLKKILNRYMGLPFTQHQPTISCDDLCEAGLGEAFSQAVKDFMPEMKLQLQVAEPVAIEVRGIAIPLDEEVSFSYYRFLSLQSPVYTLPLLPKLERYRQYCQQSKTQDPVLASSPLEKALKKRALYDFMQDMLPVVHHVPVLRLSVYDQFSEGERTHSLADILAEDDVRCYHSVADYISDQLEELDSLFLGDY